VDALVMPVKEGGEGTVDRRQEGKEGWKEVRGVKG
jgi:hypothetical protein